VASAKRFAEAFPIVDKGLHSDRRGSEEHLAIAAMKQVVRRQERAA
jgi:hypothetical protein